MAQSVNKEEQHVSTNPYSMQWLGSLEPFNEAATSWESYTERIEQFFSLNNVPDEKKTSFLLMCIGQKSYDILRDICQPDKPATKGYENLVELMKNHLQPKPSVMSERYKFHKITQLNGQSISDFVLCLKRAATNCDFENRDISLRDQFVSGLLSDNLKKRLFTETKLTFKSAVEISLSWESADHDVATVHVPAATGINYSRPIFKKSNSKQFHGKWKGNNTKPSQWVEKLQQSGCSSANVKSVTQPRSNINNSFCSCCGRNNHVKSKCRYLQFSCRLCHTKGHLIAVCPKKRSMNRPMKSYGTGRQNQITLDLDDSVHKSLENDFVNMSLNDCNDNSDDGMFNIKETVHLINNDVGLLPTCTEGYEQCSIDVIESDFSLNTVNVYKPNSVLVKNEPPYMIKVEVERKMLSMELDTGSPISAVSERDYRSLFSHCKLIESELALKSYNGTALNPLGYIKVNVKHNDIADNLDLYVFRNGGLPLLGRSWMKALKYTLNVNNVNNMFCSDVDKLYNKFPNVFAGRLGTYNKRKISLKVKPDTIPVYCKPRPVPFALQDKVNIEIENLVKQGILEPVDISDWGTPIVSIPKPDGSIRVCGDFSVTLNPCLKVERYPLPKIENILAKLSGSSYFSKIDLKLAYHQLMLDDDSKILTTISTNKGLFCYTRIPYGITSAPYIFQKIIDMTLINLNKVAVFQDDVIIGGNDKLEHIKNVTAVLQRLNDVGFTVKKEKCEFFKTSINYLGYHIDKNGCHTDKGKIDAILRAPEPKNVTELKGFLGMVNFYGRFVCKLADVLQPMYRLLSKNVTWEWSKECSDAFVQVKNLLTKSPCLIHYNSELPLKLACDASSYGLGCVLSHVVNGQERPIAYASRVLSKAECNYSQIEKEALSIIYGVKKFYQYLYGRHFTLLTDHQPLLTIFGKKKGIPPMAANRLQRWAYFLTAFDFNIQYVCSSKHGNADCLSRLPINDLGLSLNENNSYNDDDFDYLKFIQASCFPVSAKNVSSETIKDVILKKVLDYTLHGWPNQTNVTDELRYYYLKRNELSVEENCILWGYRIIIPVSLRNSLLCELHTTHLGIVKMKSIARSTFWWPNIDIDIEEVANSCEFCQNERKNPPKNVSCKWNIPNGPWERIHMDFFGPINNQMYLLVIDAYSKFLEIIPMRSITATSVIGQLRQIFARFGLPYFIVTDNGPTWTSLEFATFLQLNCIKHTLTAPYHPATNGSAERAVQTVKKCIKIALKQGKDVNTAIIRFLFDYRNVSHCITCKSPSELMFGRKLRSRFDVLRPDRIGSRNVLPYKHKENLSEVVNSSFNINQVVLVKDYRTSQVSNWVKANIVKQLSPVSYLVRLVNSDIFWKRHCDQILPINTSVQPVKEYSGVNESNKYVLSPNPVSNKSPVTRSSPKVYERCVQTKPNNRRSLLISPSPNKVLLESQNETCSSPKFVEKEVVDSDRPNDMVEHENVSHTVNTPVKSPSNVKRYPVRVRVPKKLFDL